MNKAGLLLIAVMAFGCATTKYGFRPAGPVASAEAGYPASHYAIPQQAPRGEVYVTSFGTREIDAGGDAGTQLIHVRLAVANNTGDGPWTLDPSQQKFAPAGGAAASPDFMEIDGRPGTDANIPKGQRRVFDLYYRMPGGAPDASALPNFELQWQVGTGGAVVAERTPFVREPFQDYGEPPRRYAAVGVAPWWAWGFGPGWWGWYGGFGPWGYPYYGWGPYIGVGFRYGYGYGYGYRPYYGGYGGRGYYGGGRGGGYGRGGGGLRAPVTRGRSR